MSAESAPARLRRLCNRAGAGHPVQCVFQIDFGQVVVLVQPGGEVAQTVVGVTHVLQNISRTGQLLAEPPGRRIEYLLGDEAVAIGLLSQIAVTC